MLQAFFFLCCFDQVINLLSSFIIFSHVDNWLSVTDCIMYMLMREAALLLKLNSQQVNGKKISLQREETDQNQRSDMNMQKTP